MALCKSDGYLNREMALSAVKRVSERAVTAHRLRWASTEPPAADESLSRSLKQTNHYLMAQSLLLRDLHRLLTSTLSFLSLAKYVPKSSLMLPYLLIQFHNQTSIHIKVLFMERILFDLAVQSLVQPGKFDISEFRCQPRLTRSKGMNDLSERPI